MSIGTQNSCPLVFTAPILPSNPPPNLQTHSYVIIKSIAISIKWKGLNDLNRLRYLGVGAALIFILTGCTADKVDDEQDKQNGIEEQEPAKNEENTEAPKESSENDEPAIETTELTVESETAQLIEKDEGIERAIIQLETIGDKKFVNAHISLNMMMKGEETAEKYADLLQEKHPDRTVDMIISMDGDVLYQGTFEN